jgi:hypothetical protein
MSERECNDTFLDNLGNWLGIAGRRRSTVMPPA